MQEQLPRDVVALRTFHALILIIVNLNLIRPDLCRGFLNNKFNYCDQVFNHRKLYGLSVRDHPYCAELTCCQRMADYGCNSARPSARHGSLLAASP